MIDVSVVSHGHGDMIHVLIKRLLACPEVSRIILTSNSTEKFDSLPQNSKIKLIVNKSPKGFSENHNAAFRYCESPFYCVINPDIEWRENPFSGLLACMKNGTAALAAPLVLSSKGEVDDSIRHFPTLGSLLKKFFWGDCGQHVMPEDRLPYFPDWVAGMFMLFRSHDFNELSGFNEAYHLYYEDVDICKRLHKAGLLIVACPSVEVIHHGQRASRKNFQHLRWHVVSMLRYLLTR